MGALKSPQLKYYFMMNYIQKNKYKTNILS